MREVTFFCEDSFHEKFVGALVRRVAKEHSVPLEVRVFSATHGLPRMHGQFKDFLRDLDRGRESPPDRIVVVADANCTGYTNRKQDIAQAASAYTQFDGLVTYAIPDPHIERWMLADPVAFKRVFGHGCTLPSITCAKDAYKKLLRKEIRDSDIDPPLGGEEYAEDIVREMRWNTAEKEPSLRLFLRDLRAVFKTW